MPKSETIERTLLRLVQPGMSPKALLKVTRLAHPKATRKEIVRAAFSTMIELADREPEKAKTLQGFGLDERVGGDAE